MTGATKYPLVGRPIRVFLRLDLLAVAVLLGLTGCQSGHAAKATPAQHAPPKAAGTAPASPRCAFYGVTLALGLLQKDDRHLPATAKLRDAWAHLVAEAHTVDRLFAGPSTRLRPLATKYKGLLTTIDEAAAALQRGDRAQFRSLIDHSRPTLASVSNAASRAHLKCTIKSANGATLTFGG
jgi:hypothetical protein